jgi:hypothetical protein
MKTSQLAGLSALDDAFGSLKEGEGEPQSHASGGGGGVSGVRLGDMHHAAPHQQQPPQQQQHLHSRDQQMQRIDRSEYGEQILERNYEQRQQRLEQVHQQNVAVGRLPLAAASALAANREPEGSGSPPAVPRVEPTVVQGGAPPPVDVAPSAPPPAAEKREQAVARAEPVHAFFSPLKAAPPSAAARVDCTSNAEADEETEAMEQGGTGGCLFVLAAVILLLVAAAALFFAHSSSPVHQQQQPYSYRAMGGTGTTGTTGTARFSGTRAGGGAPARAAAAAAVSQLSTGIQGGGGYSVHSGAYYDLL